MPPDGKTRVTYIKIVRKGAINRTLATIDPNDGETVTLSESDKLELRLYEQGTVYDKLIGKCGISYITNTYTPQEVCVHPTNLLGTEKNKFISAKVKILFQIK